MGERERRRCRMHDTTHPAEGPPGARALRGTRRSGITRPPPPPPPPAPAVMGSRRYASTKGKGEGSLGQQRSEGSGG